MLPGSDHRASTAPLVSTRERRTPDHASAETAEIVNVSDEPRHLAEIRSLSIVLPVFNEKENVPLIAQKLFAMLDSLAMPYEIIAVNDGSTDGSTHELARIAASRSNFRVINFRRNFGQTAAIMAGIDYASGDVIVSIDSDLQNDPDDIPLLLDKLAEGHHVVSGWRKSRQDGAIRRNLVSRTANRLISWLSGVPLHDYGCTLKAYRSDVIKGVRLYGEMHRFIPIYAKWMGASIAELPVRHYPRRFGKSKYGLERTLKVLLDLIVLKFLERYFVKPIYIFGGFGALSLLTAFASVGLMLFLKFVHGVSMIQTPLPVLSAMTFLIGIVSILMGLLAEIMTRTYFESQSRAAYLVRDTINVAKPAT
jgi:glycosyltransferase involved in cell wall biosynthesis